VFCPSSETARQKKASFGPIENSKNRFVSAQKVQKSIFQTAAWRNGEIFSCYIQWFRLRSAKLKSGAMNKFQMREILPADLKQGKRTLRV
jgi:hypothetical protein